VVMLWVRVGLSVIKTRNAPAGRLGRFWAGGTPGWGAHAFGAALLTTSCGRERRIHDARGVGGHSDSTPLMALRSARLRKILPSSAPRMRATGTLAWRASSICGALRWCVAARVRNPTRGGAAGSHDHSVLAAGAVVVFAARLPQSPQYPAPGWVPLMTPATPAADGGDAAEAAGVVAGGGGFGEAAVPLARAGHAGGAGAAAGVVGARPAVAYSAVRLRGWPQPQGHVVMASTPRRRGWWGRGRRRWRVRASRGT
jgi:hypothetical protein